jgi:hypothetical protein
MRSNLGNLKTRALTSALILASTLTFIGGKTCAAEATSVKESSLTERPAAYIRDYLSDPRRTGSLAGSILGGALSAHPAGPIVGSLVGFFVGKQSMHSEEKSREQRSSVMYARRDIVPQSNGGVATLSLSNAAGIAFDQQPTLSGPTLKADSATPASLGYSRDQIALMCSGQARLEPHLRSLCFYFQGG